jgi:hypothetical protein
MKRFILSLLIMLTLILAACSPSQDHFDQIHLNLNLLHLPLLADR